jgi:hypothetical protein
MMKFPIYGKIKNVPNHQPENDTILNNHGIFMGESWDIHGFTLRCHQTRLA